MRRDWNSAPCSRPGICTSISASEADRRKDEFLATLAHELRNPLAPLRHGLDILRKNPGSADADDIRNMMDRQLVHLVRLIDDLLDVSRVTQGKIELRNKIIQAADVIRSALEASRPLIEAAGHALTVEISPDAIWLDADLTRLAQVVSNLLNNAAKYTPEGGHLTLSLQRDRNDTVIAVRDTGVGIPANMQSKVFELFTQIDQPDDRARGGLGIGLALVRQLVAMHDGSVAVESPGAGKGSTFTVRIPIADTSAMPPPEAKQPCHSAPASRSLKVLVVDDNEAVGEAVGMMLEVIGHTYQLVDDGRKALAAAVAFSPDVIVLDIGLPGMDGYAVCRALRQDDRFKTIPIIAQTGWGRERDKVSANEAGFDHHLVKPVTLAQLEELLAGIAEKSGRIG